MVKATTMLVRWTKFAALLAAGIPIFMGILMMLGWTFGGTDVSHMRQVGPGAEYMTAIGLIFSGFAITGRIMVGRIGSVVPAQIFAFITFAMGFVGILANTTPFEFLALTQHPSLRALLESLPLSQSLCFFLIVGGWCGIDFSFWLYT